MPTLKQLGEFGLIERLTRGLPHDRTVYTGVGDDAAVLCGGPDWRLLVTTDLLVEGTHFLRTHPPALIGRKALAVSLSDIAAMGGTPWAAVIAAGIPRGYPLTHIEALYRGLRTLAREFHVNLVGGDTVRAKHLTLNVTLLGWAHPRAVALRSGARPGDIVYVTGRLGNSYRSGRHLRFTPRVREAQALMRIVARPTAMMDLSDGLASDLRRLAEQSRVGFHIDAARIPRAAGADLAAALHDGEDFELLFTVPRRRAAHVPSRVRGVAVTRIGVVTPRAQGLRLIDALGVPRTLPPPRFRHF